MTRTMWEEAVVWLRNQPEQADLVRDCYYDDPIIEAARRYEESHEWQAILNFLPLKKGTALDLGAGRGISSYALVKAGWEVTALEPNPSDIVGAGTIRSLSKDTGLPIKVIEKSGEELPFANNSFDLVFGRQVLHHAEDLNLFCREVSRVLKPGGRFISAREHIISKSEDLQYFLDNHPLNFMYGGENAFTLSQYIEAIKESGLRIKKVLGSFDSVINYFPLSYENWVTLCSHPMKRVLGTQLTSLVVKTPYIGKRIINLLAHYRSRKDQKPGRMYSFICEKPNN